MMVEEQDRKDAVLMAMSDPYMRRILAATMIDAKSIEEISRERSIPLSSCYRRVRDLVSMRLLRIAHTIITENGKKYETYRSVFSDARVSMSSGVLSVEVTVIPTSK
ncbi:MAG: helix-turn-helix transcriptional regulator [Nitrososphaerota archaeon]|nr:helix-turn-helix transcriptional regulator [Nitrososphaerota archaeon]